MDHLMEIEQDTIIDKEKATEVAIARRLKEAQANYDILAEVATKKQ